MRVRSLSPVGIGMLILLLIIVIVFIAPILAIFGAILSVLASVFGWPMTIAFAIWKLFK